MNETDNMRRNLCVLAIAVTLTLLEFVLESPLLIVFGVVWTVLLLFGLADMFYDKPLLLMVAVGVFTFVFNFILAYLVMNWRRSGTLHTLGIRLKKAKRQ